MSAHTSEWVHIYTTVLARVEMARNSVFFCAFAGSDGVSIAIASTGGSPI